MSRVVLIIISVLILLIALTSGVAASGYWDRLT